jgi:hypothetical protein
MWFVKSELAFFDFLSEKLADRVQPRSTGGEERRAESEPKRERGDKALPRPFRLLFIGLFLGSAGHASGQAPHGRRCAAIIDREQGEDGGSQETGGCEQRSSSLALVLQRRVQRKVRHHHSLRV